MKTLEQAPPQPFTAEMGAQMTSAGPAAYETSMPQPATSAAETGVEMGALQTVHTPEAPLTIAPAPPEDVQVGRLQAAKEALFSNEAAQARSEFYHLGGVALGAVLGRTARSLDIVKGKGENTQIDIDGATKVIATSAVKGALPRKLAKAAATSIRPSDIRNFKAAGKAYGEVAKTTIGKYKDNRSNNSSPA